MKILYVTTIGRTMRFFETFIKELVNGGHSVDIATNESNSPIPESYNELGCYCHHIDFSRFPLSLDNLKAFGQLRSVIENGNYDIVHCHTPNAAVITRFVCRNYRKKKGLTVFYTAHGFHFYKGAPMLNWMAYYPIEKLCSRYTDKLITINIEDYELAKKKFKAKEVHYVPGVGVDLSRFQNVQVDRAVKRFEIGILEEAFLLVSVGELIPRKNHSVILEALAKLENEDVHYIIVGHGELLNELQSLAKAYNIQSRVHFLGYRKDVAELYAVSDLCCFPSIHEGLPVALMEAMASGLPIVCSNIRGNVDLINHDGGKLINPHDVTAWSDAIQSVISGDMEKMGEVNRSRVKDFSIENILITMKSIYEI